jgi:hypothetical protein
MKNTTPILVLTGLAIVAAFGIAGLTRDSWMGSGTAPTTAPQATTEATQPPPPEQPSTTTAEPAAPPAEQPAATAETAAPAAEQPAATAEATAPETEAQQPAEPQAPEQQAAIPAAGAQQPATAAAAPQVPTFDTVRVEKSGEAVIAGRAAAGADVTVKLDGQEIGKTTANDDGAFVLVPERPLPAGSGALTIEARGRDDQAPVASEQSVAVIVPAGQQQEALVAVVSPNEPTRVLQTPAAPEPEAAQPEVTVATAEETPAAEQPATEEPAAEQKPAKLVSIDAVDYDSTGNIVFSGQGEAGNTARIYVDNNFLGDAPVDAEGRWTYSGTADIAQGVHTLRVDGLDAKGSVVNRVEVPFFREDQTKVAAATPPEAQPAEEQPAAEQPAAQQPAVEQPAPEAAPAQPAAPAAAEAAPGAATAPETVVEPAPQPESGEQVVVKQPAADEPAAEPSAPAEDMAADTAAPAEQAAPKTNVEAAPPAPAEGPSETAAAPVAGEAASGAAAHKEGRIVIQPGNNLWRISRVLYGTGAKFTVLYEANKDQIRNPNLIYPGQVFKTPDVAPKAGAVDPHRRRPLAPEENADTE